MSKRLLYTHIDMDGCGSAILIKALFNNDIDVKYVNYDFEDDPEFIESILNYDEIYFTDISINPDKARMCDKATKVNNKKIFLIDHHQTAYDALNEFNYDWIYINTKNSGSYLVLEELNNSISENYNSKFSKYVGELINTGIVNKSSLISITNYYKNLILLIDDYDLFNFKYEDSIKYQFIFNTLGKEMFTNRFLTRDYRLSPEELAIANDKIDILNNSVEVALQNSKIYTDIYNRKFMIVSNVPKFTSLVSKEILDNRNTEISYIVLLNNFNYYSIRSRRSEEVDVSEIAKIFDGGGHYNASGFKCDNIKYNLIESLINQKLISNNLPDSNKDS